MRKRNHFNAWLILFVCSVFIILRLPSLFEPHWYADEGIYQVVGRAINDGRILYQGIWDNKPPVLYLIYAIFNGNLFFIKLYSLLVGVTSVIVFYFLSIKLFKKNWSIYISIGVYTILFASPIIEGNIANAENFMILPIVTSAFLIFKYLDGNKIKNLIASGFFLSIAFATKTVAVFDFFAFFLFLFLIQKEDKKLFIKKTLLYFFLPFTSAVVIFSLYFLLTGAFGDFVNSVFLQNVSYVGEQNKLLFPMGMLVLKTMILVSLVGFIYLYREKIPRATLFIYIWGIFSIYNAFFSDRPYTHYLIVLLPAFSLIVGHFYEYLKTRLIDLVLLILIGYLAIIHFEIYQKNISYYTNFIDVLMNKKSIIAYQSFFDKNTPLQYDIANFIKANVRKDEQVFLWSDNAQIYALSNKLPVGKYIVAYHITFYKNAEAITKMQIDTSRPKYIIQTIDIPLRQDILTSYRLRYIMTGAKIYERKI